MCEYKNTQLSINNCEADLYEIEFSLNAIQGFQAEKNKIKTVSVVES